MTTIIAAEPTMLQHQRWVAPRPADVVERDARVARVKAVAEQRQQDFANLVYARRHMLAVFDMRALMDAVDVEFVELPDPTTYTHRGDRHGTV